MAHIGQELAFGLVGSIGSLTRLAQFLRFGHAGLGHEQINAQAGKENQHKGKEEEHPLIDARNLPGYC